jgi:DNA mismatch endonuclease (patch repair protein)
MQGFFIVENVGLKRKENGCRLQTQKAIAMTQKQLVRKKAGHRSWKSGNARITGGNRGDIMSAEKRSALMSRIQGKNTGPEMTVVGALSRLGFLFRRYANDLPGKPDIVFDRSKIAVFIDGDFWHGWRFPLWEGKLTKKWRDKINANRIRDRRNFRLLRRLGWKVLRIWEHQIEQNLPACLKRITRTIDEQLRH